MGHTLYAHIVNICNHVSLSKVLSLSSIVAFAWSFLLTSFYDNSSIDNHMYTLTGL